METNNLEEKTCQYWDENWEIKRYINELLPEEIQYLQEQKRLEISKIEILVQLVGFSWEPLLISVCAYKPKELIMILNRFYNEQQGEARGRKFKEYIEKLKGKNLICEMPEILPHNFKTIGSDTSEDVFRFLKRHILPKINEGKNVIIDITGAKKSMVSGAYLFASYTNCPVSYLDYDKYDEKYGKPYGYTCKINELKNPMELFKLREWSRVETLYEQYAFHNALDIINDIIKNTASYFESYENSAIELLKQCIQFYEIWDNGDYREALKKYNLLKETLNLPCPSAVRELGEVWYSKNDLKNTIGSLEGLNDITKSIYLQDDKILVYAKDELEKIKRLIKYNKDCRSALLRAAGLSEFLLKARMIKLWVEDKVGIKMDNKFLTRKELEDNNKNKYDKKLLEFAGVQRIIKFLSKKGYVLNLDKEVKAQRSDNAKMLDESWKEIKSTGLDIFNLRNKAIHFCLSVPEEIAKVAVDFTAKNLEEFKNNWSENHIEIERIYTALDWHKLCDACNITFLPKLRR